MRPFLLLFPPLCMLLRESIGRSGVEKKVEIVYRMVIRMPREHVRSSILTDKGLKMDSL